jgi:peptidoglycan/xylan/chitin deacetylase (PgdA/CDA1 family)
LAGQLDHLAERGWEFVPLARLLRDEPSGHRIAVTFDDALETQLTAALPELAKRQIPATAFVVTDYVGREARWDYTGRRARHASWSQLAEWRSAGMCIGSHGRSHRDLRRLDDAAIGDEMSASRQILEDHLECDVFSVSYPFGRHNARVLHAARQAGYRIGLSSDASRAEGEIMAYPRVLVSRLDTPLSIEQRLSDTVWGGVERLKQRIITYWAGGTPLYQRMRGHYK